MIIVKGLTKKYGHHVALNNVSFNVGKGEIIGFLGPNGAGKTTCMNILTGFISATEGSVSINGFDILEQPEKAKKHIGYLPDHPPLYNDMLLTEYLDFVCDLKGIQKNKQVRKKMINDITDLVKLSHMKDRLLKNLSKGYKQRVGLSQALVGDPEVMILDEPMVGLDPQQIIDMRDVIKELGKKHTLLLSSHILPEVRAVCDRVLILHKGQIVASDTPEKLAHSLNQGDQLSIRVKGTKEEIVNTLKATSVIKNIQVIGVREEGTYDLNLSSENGTDIREIILNALSEKKLPLYMMKSLDVSLEDIFLQLTADSIDYSSPVGGKA